MDNLNLDSNIQNWEQYLGRNTVSALNVNAPYTPSVNADTMFEGGELSASTIRTGTLTAVQTLGGSANGKVTIDGQNDRIVVTDASGVDRIIIGFLKGGF